MPSSCRFQLELKKKRQCCSETATPESKSVTVDSNILVKRKSRKTLLLKYFLHLKNFRETLLCLAKNIRINGVYGQVYHTAKLVKVLGDLFKAAVFIAHKANQLHQLVFKLFFFQVWRQKHRTR